ncbi:hypothetical protein PhaeoP97_03433 [Phaeobacter porticola]|uniref:Uncharacterized protein n=1 Tax=Phaeobacter porticola TaxID=1844006 RepID=A0A1L3I9Q7_9RHOB|nr:hypothetical protein PhaeoP97_03433 [Phaeobacter porticola]
MNTAMGIILGQSQGNSDIHDCKVIPILSGRICRQENGEF